MSALHISRPAEGVVLIEIDAPPANALGSAIRARFIEALDEADADLSVRAVIIGARGKAFCSGDDLREMAGRGTGAVEAIAQFNRFVDRVEALRAPTIAAVDGWCIGGGLELALACDIRIASSAASFTAAGVNVGLMASVWRLPRLIGVARAKAMLLTGASFDAESALAHGLVTGLHAPDALMPEALKLAERIASRAPLAVEGAKRMAGKALDLTQDQARAAYAAEVEVLAVSADHAAAVAAFAEKRQPKFTRS